jgi:hypothetical protein
LENYHQTQLFAQEMETVLEQINALVNQVTLVNNVNQLFVSEFHLQIHLFVHQEENVLHQIIVHAMLDTVEMNVN